MNVTDLKVFSITESTTVTQLLATFTEVSVLRPSTVLKSHLNSPVLDFSVRMIFESFYMAILMFIMFSSMAMVLSVVGVMASQVLVDSL